MGIPWPPLAIGVRRPHGERRSFAINVDVVLPDRWGLTSYTRVLGSIPYHCRHEVLRPEHLVQYHACPVLLVVVEVQPHRTIVGQKQFYLMQAVAQKRQPYGIVKAVSVLGELIAGVERRIQVGELYPSTVLILGL